MLLRVLPVDSQGAVLTLAASLLLCSSAAQALTINGGATLTSNPNVQLQITPPSNTYQVAFQNESATPVYFTSLASSMPWTLSPEDGLKTVNATYSYYYYFTYQCGSYACGSHCCSWTWYGTCNGYCTDYCPKYCTGQGSSTSSDSAQIILDQTPPTLTHSLPPDGSHIPFANLGITATASDANGIREARINNAPVQVSQSGDFGTTIPLQAGANQISVATTDNAGNSTSINRTIYYDMPQNGVCGPADGQSFTAPPTSGFCAVGSPYNFSSPPWSWKCSGIYGGASVDCSASLISWAVTPSAGPNGTISPDTPQSVPHGTAASFTVTPVNGYRIAEVTGTCGGTLTGATYTTSAVTGNCTVAATFDRETRLLTVDTTGAGVGTVTSSTGGISCTSGSTDGCSASVILGADVTLTAIPNGISLFGSWSGDCSGSGPCVISMTDTRSVGAEFYLADKARIDAAGYPSLADAYAAAGPSADIKLLEDLLPINWTIDKMLRLLGGYERTFSNQTGYTTLEGTLAIGTGSITAERLIIK